MRNFPWGRLILSMLILAILIGSSGCQAAGGAAKGMQSFWDKLSTVPHRVEQAVINLFSSIGSVGSALVESIKNMVGGMMGK